MTPDLGRDMFVPPVDGGMDLGPGNTVGVCGECTADRQCENDARCILFGGRNLCLLDCTSEFESCPNNSFSCVSQTGVIGNFCVATNCCVDNDGDGYGLGIDCLGDDCNDNPAGGGSDIFPGVPEICDGVDNNCVGGIDEPPTDCAAAGCDLNDDSSTYSEFEASSCETGACTVPALSGCGNYTCDGGGADGDACATTCLVLVSGVGAVQDDARCIITSHCVAAGTCVPDLPDGSVCLEDTDCGSSHCENGFCCADGDCCGTENSDCPGFGTSQAVCESRATCQGTRGIVECNVSSHICSTQEGVADDTRCNNAEPARECGLFLDTFCDGTADQDPTDTDCLTVCTGDQDCDSGAFCNENGACELPRPDGRPCGDDNYCENDFCTNGFCCDGRTGDDCCGNADDCPASYSDVRTCTSPSTCTGFREYATCINSICDTNLNTSDATACSTSDQQSNCGLFPPIFCTGTSFPNLCEVFCESEADCDANAHCDPDGTGFQTCVVDVPNGNSCDESSDCSGGHCFNGFCCGTDASGVCCASASNCPGSFTTAATCNNPATCQGSRFDALCTNNQCATSATPTNVPSACTGSLASSCGFFDDAFCQVNGTASCITNCTSSTQCDEGANCMNGACVPNAGQGGACTNDANCSGGLLCIDGVCCNVPSGRCEGSCEACNVAGSVGVCAPIPTGTDPANECAGISCDGYYANFTGDACYERIDRADNEVGCRGGSSRSCQTAPDVCPTSGRTPSPIVCNASCQDPVNGTCAGTSPGQCQNVTGSSINCGVGACLRTVNSCSNGAPQSCVAGSPSTEVCNRRDDDCDGQADDRLAIGDRADTCTSNVSHHANKGGDGTWVTSSAIAEALYNPDQQNPTGDVDYYYVQVTGEGQCWGDNEGAQMRAQVSVPSSASGSYRLCVEYSGGGGCENTVDDGCVDVAPGQTSDWVTVTSEEINVGGTGCDSWNRYATVTVSPVNNAWSCDNYQITLSGREYDIW
ncbi:MAG: putative metal-binding motif-containing protein [Sandaracinaceae bacterium]|nr:putative metal-binding motif-containing protein [Sandaracinaceae bacterium]